MPNGSHLRARDEAVTEELPQRLDGASIETTPSFDGELRSRANGGAPEVCREGLLLLLSALV